MYKLVIKVKSSSINNISRLNSLLKIVKYVPFRLKKLLFFSFLLILLAGVLEAETIKYVSIFLEKISQISTSNIYADFKETSINFIFFAIASSIARIIIVKFNLNIGASISNYLSSELFNELTFREYETSLSQKESVDIDLITWQVAKAGGLINTFLITISVIFINLSIIYSLIDFGINKLVIILIIFVSFYGTLAIFLKRKLRLNSKVGLEANRYAVKAIQEVSCLRTEINLGLNSKPFLRNFQEVDMQGKKALASSEFLALLPRYLVEGLVLVIGTIYISILYSQEEIINLIPLIGTLAFASQKLLPNFQQIFQGWSKLNSQGDSLIEVNKVLENLNLRKAPENISSNEFKQIRKKTWKNIELKNISYSYSLDKEKDLKVISEISLNIQKGDKIAIYGPSGSGKSTIVKLISGLLKPKSGEIYLDNINVHLNLNSSKKLKSLISYVPQQTQILNSSIFENLFLNSKSELCKKKYALKKVLKCCVLEDFVKSQPNGIDTVLGFRGQTISGGQRQRLAIARAILQQREILILDEATVGLDKKMEDELLRNIHNYFNKLTIIHISHDPNVKRFYSRYLNLKG